MFKAFPKAACFTQVSSIVTNIINLTWFDNYNLAIVDHYYAIIQSPIVMLTKAGSIAQENRMVLSGLTQRTPGWATPYL